MGKLERDLIKYTTQMNYSYMSWHDDDAIEIFKYIVSNANSILSELEDYSYIDNYIKMEIETFSIYMCEVDDYKDFVNGIVPFSGSVNILNMDETFKLNIYLKNNKIDTIYATDVETEDEYEFAKNGKWVKEYKDGTYTYWGDIV